MATRHRQWQATRPTKGENALVSGAHCRLHLSVSPGASRSEVVSTPEGLRVRVAAPAREGKANRALVSFLAKRLDVAPSRITIVHGEGSRHKTVEVDGLTHDEALNRLVAD